MPGAWDPGGQAELHASTTQHTTGGLRLRKAVLGNPRFSRHKDHGLIRGKEKGICGKEDHCGNVLQVRSDF